MHRDFTKLRGSKSEKRVWGNNYKETEYLIARTFSEPKEGSGQLDIQTAKEAAYKKFEKSENHRAMQDVVASIEELKHFRKYFFVK